MMTSGKFWKFTIVFLVIVASQTLASEDDFEEPFIEEEPETNVEKEKYTAPPFQSPKIDNNKVFFLELFQDKNAIGKKWLKSESKKEGAEEAISKYDGEWSIGIPSEEILSGDYSLIVQTKARHHAIAAKLQKPFKFDGKPLVLQYEVKYEQGQECGGGYLKLLKNEVAEDLRQFNDKSAYVIMFGPDKCGMSSKIHFILRHKNPKNGTVSEHHAKQSSKSLTNYFEDKKTHLYTLVINPDNSFKVSVDNVELMSGNLLSDLEPPVIPPKQISDPDDKKPSDWDDRAVIEDSDAKKPDDWDENQPKEVLDEDAVKPSDWLEEEEPLIPDTTAEKPEDWDDEMDGDWEPRKVPNPKCEGRSGCGEWKKPMKQNPLYKGKWSPPKITNPNYKGQWSPRLIENPHYFEEIALEPIAAIGIELWTMSSGIVFDNIIITEVEEVAKSLADQTYVVKKAQEKVYQSATDESKNIFKSVIDATEEKPWLWAVIISVVLIPIILIAIFCFGRKSSKKADHKKTDEPVEDEEVVEMEEAGNEEEVTKETEGEPEEQIEEVGAETIDKQRSSASSSTASSKASTPLSGKKKQPKVKEPNVEEPPSPPENTESSPRPTRRLRARRQE